MKKLIALTLLLFITVGIQAGCYELSSVGLKDGDTVTANIHLGFGIVLINQSIRLDGIDTPETRTTRLLEKKAGLLVTEWLRRKIAKGKQFVLVTSGRDRGNFGRPLGCFLIDGVDICTQLLRKGFARMYHPRNGLWTDEQLNHIINDVRRDLHK